MAARCSEALDDLAVRDAGPTVAGSRVVRFTYDDVARRPRTVAAQLGHDGRE